MSKDYDKGYKDGERDALLVERDLRAMINALKAKLNKWQRREYEVKMKMMEYNPNPDRDDRYRGPSHEMTIEATRSFGDFGLVKHWTRTERLKSKWEIPKGAYIDITVHEIAVKTVEHGTYK